MKNDDNIIKVDLLQANATIGEDISQQQENEALWQKLKDTLKERKAEKKKQINEKDK